MYIDVVADTLLKKVRGFPIPMSLIKLPLAGKNLIITDLGEFGKWHPGRRRENQ